MDLVIILLTLFPLVISNVFDSRLDNLDNLDIEKDTKLFEVDKMKLQQLWQYATTKALIKAHTRASLQDLPRIERIVFEQCASDAKTVVALASCAVRVFDTKQYAQSFTAPPPPPKLKTNYFTILKKTRIQKIQVAPSKTVMEYPYMPNDTLYYSTNKQKWVKNPIRKQIRRRSRIKRMDEMMQAYEIFLEEERRKKKLNDSLKKLESIQSEQVEHNAFGLPRVMKIPREKRSIEDAPTVSTPNIDFTGLASKYFSRLLLGNRDGSSETNHLNNIRRLRSHFLRVEKCNGYFKLMNEENKKLFEELKLGIYSRDPKFDNEHDAIQNILEIINQFSASKLLNDKFSFLSPRILSILPENKNQKNKFLSPTLLSFQRDGFFSLPDLFDIVSSNERYQQLMLEAIFDLSGAGEAMEKLIKRMEPSMKLMEEVQYPLVQKLSRQDINWIRARRLFSSEQEMEYKKLGFAHLTTEQIKHVYSSNYEMYLPITNLTRRQREERIEMEIRKLAAEGKPKWPVWGADLQRRFKRAEENIPNYPHEEEINGVSYLTLKPHAFANLVNFGVSMEAMILSPHAFISEIIRPEALKLDVLSPRAFIATVLSPSALIARILSPTAFRAEVLSPRALTAWVLSPEALVAEVLSPRVLEPRVLSPEALVIDVLSPGILAPHVMSAEALGVMILSPNVLSPRIASEEKFLVEILSPHILGGPHSKEEHEHDVVEVGAHSEEEHKPASEGEHHGAERAHSAAIRNFGTINSQRSILPHYPFHVRK